MRLGGPLAAAAVLLAGCGGDADDGTITIYTTVTEETVTAVVDLFTAANPEATVEVFRAPTGEVTARIATEVRQGDLQADVLWLTDPLSIQQYAADGLLESWEPEEIDVVAEEYRTDTFFATRLLSVVMIHGPDTPVGDWQDLIGVDGVVAIPDPGFAGSAFGALAFFAQSEAYGMDFYESLADSGAVQVQAPADVISGVAEGRYAAGITLSQAAEAAIADGSPIVLAWPASGAVAVYSPIAVVEGSEASTTARAFVNYVLGAEAQQAIADTGWQPIRTDVSWPERGSHVAVDWAGAFDRQDELLDAYRAIFGG